MKEHHYSTRLEWTGNTANGTESYRSYSRNHIISAERKEHEIMSSSDPLFLGDPSRYNPEELLLSSISSCHMLWYLHLCATNKVTVIEYADRATGIMEEDENGSRRFTKVTLHPNVKVKEPSMKNKAITLHEEANKMCFIANSCNFEIAHIPTILVQEKP